MRQNKNFATHLHGDITYNVKEQCLSDENKVPRPDRFTVGVFQSQWDLIKEDLMKVFQEFAQGGIIHGLTNETYTCLIPEKLNSCKVKDFRPISLVTSLFKIISKVLSLRLREVLEDTISESQGLL